MSQLFARWHFDRSFSPSALCFLRTGSSSLARRQTRPRESRNSIDTIMSPLWPRNLTRAIEVAHIELRRTSRLDDLPTGGLPKVRH
jgi:hypothetical protein